MKKMLLISIILISTLWLTACGNTPTDSDVDKMVSMSCDMFWWKAGSMDMKKIEEISVIWDKIEAKYKWKEEKFTKIMEASFLRQCPDTYKKMKEMENKGSENDFTE